MARYSVSQSGNSKSKNNARTAHQLARLIYAMLTRGEEYVERDLAAMETERRDRQIKNLQRQARYFDLALVPAEQAA